MAKILTSIKGQTPQPKKAREYNIGDVLVDSNTNVIALRTLDHLIRFEGSDVPHVLSLGHSTADYLLAPENTTVTITPK